MHAEDVKINRSLISIERTLDVSKVCRRIRKANLSNKGEMSIQDAQKSGRLITVINDNHVRDIDELIQSEVAFMLAISCSKQELQLKYGTLTHQYDPEGKLKLTWRTKV